MNDLISRQAVIQMLNTADRYVADSLRLCDTDKTFPQNEVFIVDDMYEGLEQLPSAQPERKTGRWMFPYTDKRYKKCSACGRIYYSIPHDSNYCPNCGASMTEGIE